MTYGIVAEQLGKSYGGKTPALDGFDLLVPQRSVYGLLGPNGAGKTTAVRIFATLLRPDTGRAEVAGVDVVAAPRRARTRIALVGQGTAVDEILTGRQNLLMFGRLFHLDRQDAARRADELLGQFGLTDAADEQVKGYSGGMRRRLDLAASMILAPEVLFLDEPTTGLDPQGRNEVWEAVRSLSDLGTTVLLTTHYLDEADKLSDRIAVIDHGRNITDDTPAALKAAIGGDRIEVVAASEADLPAVRTVLDRVADGAEPDTDERSRRVSAPVRNGVTALVDVALSLQQSGVALDDIGIRRPTLDEAFLSLTAPATAATTIETEKGSVTL